MDLKQLEAFVAVVQHKSFSKAAVSIHLTQPTVSAHIKALEKEINSELLDRSEKKIVPTKRGRMVFDYAISILRLRENLVFEAKEASAHNTNCELRISASTVPAQYLLPKFISSFKQIKKNVRTNIFQGDSVEALENLKNGVVDFAIIGSIQDDPKLCFTPIAEDELVIILPNDEKYLKYIDNEKEVQDFAFLKEMPFVLREEGSGTRQEFEEYLKGHNLSIDKLNVVCFLGSTESVKQAVAEGMGISIISKLAASDYEKFGLIKLVGMKPHGLKRTFYLVTYKDRFISKDVEDFLKSVKTYSMIEKNKIEK